MWERPASFGWESAADEESGERFWLFEDDDQAYLWANPAWQAGVDEESGNRYWHNVDTDESTWDRPDDYASDTESERVSMEEGAKQRRALKEAAARKAKKASKPPPPPPPPAAPDSQPQPASDPSSPPPPPPPAAGPAEPAIAPGSGSGTSGDGGALPSSRGGQAQKAVRKAAVVVLASDSEASDFEEEEEDQVHATATRRVTKVSRGSGVTVKRKKATVASTEPLPPLNDALSTRLLQRIATDSTLRQGIPILKFAGPSDLTAARQVLSDSVARVGPGEEVAVEGELAAGGAVLVLDGDMDVTSEGTTRAAGPGTVLFGDTLLSGSSRYEGSLRAREHGRGAYVARLALHAMQAALGQDWLVQRGRQALESDASMLPTLLQPVPFLAAHREASAPVLMELSLVVQRPALHLVIQEGAPVDGFFVLLLGSARVAVEGRVVAECGPGAFFGEMSMLGTGVQGGGAAAAGAGAGPSSSSSSGGKLASASVVTTSPSLLLCVPRRSFGELLERCPGVADELQKHAIRRTALNLKGLGAASPLALATEAQLQALAARASIETVPAGRPVARRGDPRGHVTVVLSGTVEEQGFEPASPSSSDPMPALTGETKQRKPGDIVSASVLFEDCPSSVPADAVVAGGEPARLMRFGSQDFAAAMGGAGSAAMAAVLLRLRGGSPRARDIAAVPALSEALVKFGGSSKVRKGSVQLLGAAKKFRLLARGLAPRAGVVDVPSPDMVAAARVVEAVLQDPLEGPALQAVMGQPLYDECGKKLHASLHAAHRRRFSMMPGAGAASGAGAGGGASGGDGQRAGPMPVGLLDGAAAALDAHLAEIVSEFVDSPMYAACMRRVAESLADGGADAAGADGDSGPGSVTGGDGLGGSRRSSRLDGGAMKEPSFSQWFGVEKLNRYGQWQPRALRLHLVERQLLVHRSKTEAEQHNFDATDVAKVVRVATEQRDQLRLGFRPELEEKDYDLKFEGGETGRDDFVRMLQMLGGSTLLVEDEGEDYSSQGTGLFLTQKVGKGALFVAVQPDARILVHGSDRSAVQASAKAAEDAALLGSGDPLSAAAHAAVSVGSAGADVKSVRITWRTLIHPCNLDPTRAVVCPHGEEAPIPRAPVAPERKSTAPRSGRRLSSLIDIMGNKSGGPLWGAAHPGGADKGSMELIFSSPQARDRFTGLLRAVSEGIDIPLARATGVRRLAAAAAQEPGRESATAHRLTREGVLVCAATWNVGDSKPPKDPSELWPWLPPGRFDIYAIGLQECSSLQSWVSTICDAISSSDTTSATGAGTGAAAGGAKSAPSADANGAPSDALEYLKNRPGNFALVASHSLWEMQLLVFAREDVARTVSQLKQSSVATGLGGIIGNKGGVACGMVLGGTTRLCFMTCHLAARATRLRTRASNFAEILRRLEVGLTAQGTPANQALHDYDHFFVMGDLNYRVDLGFHGSPTEFQTVQRHIDAMDFAPLEAADQLVHQKVRGNVFAGFDEQPIRFAPTYRMVKGKALTYSNKRNQNMSWTDRVLWRSAGALRGGVQPVFYASCFSLDNSDHRPVSAGVRVPMRQPYLHLDRGLGAGSARQVVLELGGAELFDAPLSPTEQEAADAGMGAATGSPVSRSQCPKGLMELAGPDKAVKAAAELASDKKASKKGKQSAVAPPKPGKMPDAKSAARMAAEAQGVALDAGGIPRSCGPSGKRKGFDFKAGEGLFLTVSAPFVGSTAASGVVPAQDAGTLVARWSGAQLPHAVMRLADESWIAEQSVLLTVRRSTGQIVGQAELPLLDARAHASDPYGSIDGLTLARVLEHPTLLRALAAFLQMEQTPEHLAFLLVTRWYREIVLEVGRMVREGAGPDEVASAMAGAVGIAAMRGAAKEAKEDAQAAAKGKSKGKGKAKGKKKGKSAASLGLGGTDEASTPGLGGKWLGQMVRRARHKGKAAIAVRVQSTGRSAAAATGAGTRDGTGLPAWALSHVHAAARAIAQEYVGGGMPSEVNVPGSMSKAARAIVLEDMLGACSLGGAEPGSDSGWTAERAAGVFDTCAGEVLALLERDNFPRFQSALQERDRAGGRAAFGKGGGAAALGQGAPFCVQLVRDGRSVGSLRGRARLLTVGASCCRAETARECRQLESRRQLVSAESSMASLAAAQAMGAGLAGGGAAGAAEGGAMEVEGEGADDLELGSDDDEDLMAGLLQGGSSLKKVEVATGGGTDADLDPGSEMEDEDEEDDDDE